MIRRLLGEPLVHFLVLGALVFAFYRPGDERRIFVSAAEQERLATIWAGEAGRAPDARDVNGLIAAHVEEEVLTREATRLGLDEGDTIIRRRLAQKMRFTLEGLRDLDDPAEAELADWYEQNEDRFALPATVTFRHVYFSPDRRGASLDADAGAARAAILAGGDWRTFGDPFMLQRAYADIDRDALARLFGDAFADRLFARADTGWHEPVGSAFGLHLVDLQDRTPARTRPLEDIRDEVIAAWRDEAARAADARAIADLVGRYEIEIEPVR